jgi:flagellar biosynthesis/type III secretory pathway protein FliH
LSRPARTQKRPAIVLAGEEAYIAAQAQVLNSTNNPSVLRQSNTALLRDVEHLERELGQNRVERAEAEARAQRHSLEILALRKELREAQAKYAKASSESPRINLDQAYFAGEKAGHERGYQEGYSAGFQAGLQHIRDLQTAAPVAKDPRPAKSKADYYIQQRLARKRARQQAELAKE